MKPKTSPKGIWIGLLMFKIFTTPVRSQTMLNTTSVTSSQASTFDV